MTNDQNLDPKRSFLQETAFEEDVILEKDQKKRTDSQAADYIRRYWAKHPSD